MRFGSASSIKLDAVLLSALLFLAGELLVGFLGRRRCRTLTPVKLSSLTAGMALGDLCSILDPPSAFQAAEEVEWRVHG